MLIGTASYSQTCTLQTLTNVSPGAIQVNLSFSGIPQNVGAFQCTVRFDSSAMTFVNASDWYSGAAGTLVSHTAGTGKITFIDGYVPALTVTNGVLCKLNFTYIGPGCSFLKFTDSPTLRELADDNYNDYSVVNWVNGSVCGVTTGIEYNNNSPSIEIFPTIAKEKVTIKYNVPENGKITFGLYNMIGDEIQTITKECIGNNEAVLEMNVSNLNSGLYFIKYQIETASNTIVKTEKITVTR